MLPGYTKLRDTPQAVDFGCLCYQLPRTIPGLAVAWMNWHAPKQFPGTVQGLGWVRDLYQTCLQRFLPILTPVPENGMEHL